LKAGAAYVPVDAAHPPQHIERLLRSIPHRHVVVSHTTAHTTQTDEQQVLIDSSALTDSAARTVSLTPQDRIFGTFTSGSTGESKLSAATYGSFANLVSWYLRLLRPAENDRFGIVTSMGFDLTQKNVFAALATGCGLDFVSRDPFDARLIVEEIVAKGITIIN